MPAAFLLVVVLVFFGSSSGWAQALVDPPKNVVEPLPDKPPAWVAGYQVRYTLRCLGDRAQSKSQSVVARLPTGAWLRPDGLDVAVQAADGTMIPVAVLSRAATGETLIQFARHGNDSWYWAYAMNLGAAPAAGKPLPEGIVLEAMDFAGSDLSSWPAVREGLTKSPVLANAFVGDILQKANPARPDRPKNYAVTYRGHLSIKTDGVYRFFVNSEDASFLFIDGFKVCDRSGTNPRVVGNVPTRSIGNDVELKAGVHSVEVYHALRENAATYGGCMLLWAPPGAKTWAVVPREMFAQPDYAMVSQVEAQGDSVAATFEWGIDDSLVTGGGATISLARFEANGDFTDEKSLVWDFGDGTKGTGRSVRHVYFEGGDHTVSLSCGGPLPAYQRKLHVWAAPGAISPFSVGLIIESLRKSDWRKLPGERIDAIVDFLQTCDHPDRWAFLAEIAPERLKGSDLDPQYRAALLRTRVEAIGHTGKPADLAPVMQQARTEFAKLPTLLVGIEIAEAEALLRQFGDEEEAEKRFQAILEKHRRLEHPDLRWAAIGYGDLLAERGEMKQAAEMYRTAATLGGEEFLSTAQSDAVTRGALLRVAEQKLRTGNILETRALLKKIELNYPEQKLEGLYRFLRAESDRHGGRYEEALRGYEVLMQLEQWAGYRDKAMAGIADCYARRDDVDQALEWLERIDRAYPEFYEKQGLPAQRLILTHRKEWLDEQKKRAKDGAKQPGGESGAADKPVGFRGFATGFEPEEAEPFGDPKTAVKFVGSLGIAGPHVALFETFPVYPGYLTYERPLSGMTPLGRYWVEFWYREDVFSYAPGFNPHIYVYLYGPGTQIHPTRGQMTYFTERSPGAWRKIGFVMDMPTANEGRVALSSLAVAAMQIDGLSVRPVTDRQLDALSNFIDRTAEEGP